MLPDGPVHDAICTKCYEFFEDDIYRYQGINLCGDCRYWVIHGRWPNYDKNPGGNCRSADSVIARGEIAYHG